jgi:hypothetical protein
VSHHVGVRIVPRSILVLALVVACGGAPSATFSAGDLTAVQEALALRGATVLRATSGDAGCQESDLHSNVVRLDLRLDGNHGEQQVYLFRWRRPAQFEAAAEPFADCVRSFASSAGGETPVTLEVPPWRAYGTAWSDELRLTLEDALRAAGGG